MNNDTKFVATVPGAPTAIGPYSVYADNGDFIFCSGQIGIAPETGKLAGEDFKTQAIQVMSNISALINHLALDKRNILKATVFLTDLANFTEFNSLYSEWLDGHKPPRSTIGVAALPAGAKVEIEVILSR